MRKIQRYIIQSACISSSVIIRIMTISEGDERTFKETVHNGRLLVLLIVNSYLKWLVNDLANYYSFMIIIVIILLKQL